MVRIATQNRVGDSLVVAPIVELEAHLWRELQREVVEGAAQAAVRRVIFDLSGVALLDVDDVRALEDFDVMLRLVGSSLICVGLAAHVVATIVAVHDGCVRFATASDIAAALDDVP